MDDEHTCAAESLRSAEPLAGNATTDTSSWLLLEVPPPWERDAIDSPGLGDRLRQHLEAFLERVPSCRLQLIHKPQRRSTQPACFVGVSSDPAWLLELSLTSLDELLEIDLERVLAEGHHPKGARRTAPLHLVCTHGRRDRCCATFGQPFYRALAACSDEDAWQCTHVGGHRFAACIVTLPEGYCYGRLDAAQAPLLLDAHREGRLHDLASLRGRTCFSAPTQAAEVYLREHLGDRAIGALCHVETRAIDDGHEAHFEVGAMSHRVTITREALAGERPVSCGDKPSAAFRFVARSIRSTPR